MGCFMAPPLLCHRLLPFLLFCVFFFLVQIHWEVGNRENRSDHGSQNRVVWPRFARVPVFSHRTVLKAKRTAKINGSRFFRSDRTVRSGFQNLDIDVHVKNKIFIRRDAWRMEMTCCSQGRVDGFCSICNLQVMNPIFGHSLLSTTLSKKKFLLL